MPKLIILETIRRRILCAIFGHACPSYCDGPGDRTACTIGAAGCTEPCPECGKTFRAPKKDPCESCRDLHCDERQASVCQLRLNSRN